jgi:uroporphyrinogen decarboxylase
VTGAERFLAACRSEPVDATPVWFMRQSGGSLPRYLELRRRHSVIEIARTPELSAEVAVTAAETLGTDAAVLFADIMLLAEAMGVALELTSAGPVVAAPIRTLADVERLRPIDASTDLAFVLEAIGRVRASLAGRAAVIGIAGGPFTLAGYLIEGGPSRDQLVAKRLLFAAPEVWQALMERISAATAAYVAAQVAAGADAVQVFDSWAGSLAPDDYDVAVAPWTGRILAAIRDAGAPALHYAASGSALLERLARGADVVSVDAAQSIAAARERLPAGVALQGNLDAARLAGGGRVVRDGTAAVLRAISGRPGHIFNTGGPVPRDTDPHVLRDIVRLVHDTTAGPIPSHVPLEAHA